MKIYFSGQNIIQSFKALLKTIFKTVHDNTPLKWTEKRSCKTGEKIRV